MLVLGSLTALGPLTIDMYLPALPNLTADLGTTESAAQATITGMLVGLGVGQLVIGPLSDAVGRRRPLIAGVVGHLFASVLCALAPSIVLLTGARLLQGLSAAAVAVVSMAIVRDLFSGSAAATLLSRLMLVTGIAPVLAPSIGGLVLGVTSWRGRVRRPGGRRVPCSRGWPCSACARRCRSSAAVRRARGRSSRRTGACCATAPSSRWC